MLISKKNLTYTNLLYVIGKSERPLTSSEIEDETKLSKYVFKMLEKLAPTGNIMRDDRIFVLEEILSKNNDKRFESINNLKKMFDLDWEIEKKI